MEMSETIDGRTAYRIVDVVDNKGIPEANMVNSDNIQKITDSAHDFLLEIREERMNDAMSEKWQDDPVRHLQDLRRAISASHAIQCPINGRYDLGVLAENISNNAQKKGIDSEDSKLQESQDLIENTRTAKSTMVKLYEIDIARRLSEYNKDPDLFESSLPKFESLKPEILQYIEYFKTRNELSLDQSPDAAKYIQDTIDFVNTATPEQLKDGLYDRVIMSISRWIFFDWKLDSDIIEENLNELFSKE